MEHRVEIPLSLLPGNMEVLLENAIPCQSINLRRDPGSVLGVILVINFGPGQKEAAYELGFRTAPVDL